MGLDTNAAFDWPGGTPDEAIPSLDEADALFGQVAEVSEKAPTTEAEKARLLIESARIRLPAYMTGSSP